MKIPRLSGLLCTLCFLASCSSSPSRLELALQLAGDNRAELERVLNHYAENEADSLKYRAARFLIENMPQHYTFAGEEVKLYYEAIAPLIKVANAHTLDSIKSCLKTAGSTFLSNKPTKAADITHIKADYLINHIDQIFKTRDYPWNKNISFQEFCEYVLPYRIDHEPIEDWLKVYMPINKKLADSLYSESQNYTEFISKFVDFYTKNSPYINTFSFPVELHPTSLLNIRYGDCKEIALWGAYTFRSIGIPVYLDFTPNWANRSQGHFWNSISIDDSYYPFIFQDYASSGFGNHLKDRFYEEFSKIYRKTYSVQPISDTPLSYPGPYNKDITDLFESECADVTISATDLKKKYEVAYIMVFNNREWVPIGSTKLIENQATFRLLHKGCCYLASVFDGRQFIPICDPFILNAHGAIHYLIPDLQKRQSMVLFRKYPVGSMHKYANRSMGGMFQGSNDRHFHSCELLYKVEHTLEDMKWHTISIKPRRYRFYRYYSAPNGYNNIAEIEFLGQSGNKLTGEVIGYGDLIDDKASFKESAFDGNPLTFFAAKDPNDSWVGLDLGKPTAISRINYLFRNDDNNIRKGDSYELFYWEKGQWTSLDRQTAVSDSLIFQDCPAGALFILRNRTRGKEERIFTYENDRQVWW